DTPSSARAELPACSSAARRITASSSEVVRFVEGAGAASALRTGTSRLSRSMAPDVSGHGGNHTACRPDDEGSTGNQSGSRRVAPHALRALSRLRGVLPRPEQGCLLRTPHARLPGAIERAQYGRSTCSEQ